MICAEKVKPQFFWLFSLSVHKKYVSLHHKDTKRMASFINPFVDEGFKRIFGQEESKPVLLAFLQELLKGEHDVKDLKYLDKEQLRMNMDNRSLIYDIYCEVENGDHIIVEMQNKSQPFFKNRSIFYMSRSIASQGKRGRKWKYDYKAVYIVALLNFRSSPRRRRNVRHCLTT